MEDKIIGSVERVVFENKDNGYYVLNVLRADTGKECIVTANHLKVSEGVCYEFTGVYVSYKYGTQFKSTQVVEVPPSTIDAMVKYLSSSFFKGIGPSIASRIVKHFGDNTYEILKTNIGRLIEVEGISKKKLGVIKQSWQENVEINDIMLFLQKYQISTLFATKILEFFGSDCISKISINPYELMQIDGVGFKRADVVALSMGFAKDSVQRISSAIKYVLNEGESNDGHCFLYFGQLIDKCTELLGVAIKDKIDEILLKLIDDNEIKLSRVNDEERYYSCEVYYDERKVVHKIDIIKNTPGIIINDEIIKEWEEEIDREDVKLSDEQKEAVLGIVYNKISILTGGAGVGKTLCIKYLIKLLEKLKVDFTLTSPTGRAAQRMIEATNGYNASTIHRLLKWDFVNGGFIFNEKNLLNVGFLIVDECSMIGISLFASLLKALPQDTHILLVGDFNQIPPVPCGNPFKDLINSGFVKTYKLTKIFRQSDGAGLIDFSYDVINGVVPEIESPMISPEMWTNGSSCMFIDSDLFEPNKNKNDYPDYSTLYYNIDIVEMIRKLYCETINKYYPGKEIQIIEPQNIGELGTIKINKVIQEFSNPASKDKPEIKIGDNIFRKFDKVIVVKNSYDYNIFNGELGRIKEINPEDRSCIVEFGCENKTVELKKDGLLLLKLGYSCSIHKAQGSEFDIIILPVAMNFYKMLYRQLLYTGMTRSKLLTILIGSRRALTLAVKNMDQSKRQTSLIELLKLKTSN